MLDFFWVRLMGKTAGDTSVAGKPKDASEFARRAIEQGWRLCLARRYCG